MTRHGWLAFVLAAEALAQAANTPRAPSSSQQSAALAAIREYAAHYLQRLPDYMCTQVTQWNTTTYMIGNDRKRTDVIEAKIGFLDHTETEKITTVNGEPLARVNRKDLPATFSRGEFGTLLARIFAPPTPAAARTSTEFRWDRWATQDGRRMYVFSYRVPKARGYGIEENQHSTVVAFKGLVYADFETKAVMRIEMHCIDIPEESSYRSIDLTLNYKLTRVAEREFVLPFDFEMKMEQSIGAAEVTAEYKAYRRFGADAPLRFGGADPGR